MQLDPESPTGAAVKQVLLPLFDTMRSNEHLVGSGTDPDGLHVFRVASRRSRVVLSRAKKVLTDPGFKSCRKDLQWLARTTNRSRDLDVGIGSLEAHCSSLPSQDAEQLLPFDRDLRARQQRAHDKVRTALEGDRYRRFTIDYQALLATSQEHGALADTGRIADAAPAWILAAYQRVLRRGRAHGPTPSVKELHKLRLACKRLRYLMEVYESLYTEQKIAELIDSLQELQTLLGDLHDADVLRCEVEHYLRTTTTPAQATAVVNQFIGELGGRVGAIRAEFGQRFDAFARPSSEWRFRELFQPNR